MHTAVVDPFPDLQAHLRAGEQLLWHGGPDQRAWFTPADAFLIPFSVFWSGFAVFWEVNAARRGPIVLAAWGVPFVAIGLYFVAGRFVYKRYRNRRTAYGITSQRALISGPGTFSDLPWRGRPVTVRRSRDGRHATVVFDTAAAYASRRSGRPRQASLHYGNTGMELLSRSSDLLVAFYDVADPEIMLAVLEQARAQTAA